MVLDRVHCVKEYSYHSIMMMFKRILYKVSQSNIIHVWRLTFKYFTATMPKYSTRTGICSSKIRLITIVSPAITNPLNTCDLNIFSYLIKHVSEPLGSAIETRLSMTE